MKKRILSMVLAMTLLFSLTSSVQVAFAAEGDEGKVDLDRAWLDLGSTASVTSNLTLPAAGPNGSTITWSTGGSFNLWDNGTVIRPSSGKDIVVILTATVRFGAVSKTKDFSVGIPAYDSNIRTIDTVHSDPNATANAFNIDVPVGTCPKLPYRVWVNYNDGYGEWRQMQWPWSGIVGSGADRSGPVGSNTPPDQEEQWKAKPVGAKYTVTGWIIGDNATSLGYPITASCTVVAGAAATPDHIVKADALPMSKVKLTGENRLTSNANRAVTAIASWSPDTYLWNYRNTYGLEQPAGVVPPTGWEAPTQKLRGHGVGHYINAMCLAYVSGMGTQAERDKILSNIVYMIDEMRKIQALTFVQTGVDGQGKAVYREGSNVWPYYAKDKAELAPDWPFPLLSEITTAAEAGSSNASFVNGAEAKKPEWFGYGYLHATPPLHPILNEAYRPYSEWIWAPYYSIHKEMAGLMDVYYAFKDNPTTRATAEKALLICKDMGHWISNRLTTKCRIEPTRNTSTYGNLGASWYANISGEYGGVNESIARCAYALPDSDPDKALLLRGSEMFDNKFYWDPLSVNSEVMWNGTAAIGGNSHANQRIPQMPGVMWSYRGNGDPRYYTIGKNFFDFNAGRFRYYSGNVGVGEWYNIPYRQINTMGTGLINETCCATNLARLSKDLACFEPDDAQYMDYYERITYNQLAGSVVQNTWNVAYQYAVAPNTAKTDLRGTNPGESCCGGTGAENSLRYTDGAYLVSDKAIWVNMYMPTEVTWDNAGVTLKQSCVWPAESSTITVAANAGQTQKPFAMHLRVPWWATRGFDIKLNGVSVAEKFTPSSYVVIPERVWNASDVVTVTCPFIESIDYGPDRRNDQWAGVVFYGPLAMSGTGAWSTLNINYDLSNITKNAPIDLPNTSATTPGNNRNLYTMSVTGQSHSNANTLRPDYYTGFTAANYPTGNTGGSGSRTVYYMINLVPSGDGTDRTALFNKIETVKAVAGAGYSPASYAGLQGAIIAAVAVYQDAAAVQTAIDAQVAALQTAMDGLVPTADNKAALLERITTAKETKDRQEAWEALPDGHADKTIDNKPCAPYGYARMLVRLGEAQTVYADANAALLQVNAAYNALDEALKGIRLGYMPEVEDLAPLKVLIEQAKALRANDYSLDSYQAVLAALDNGEGTVSIVTAGSSTIDQNTVPDAVKMLKDALDGLVSDYAGDKTDRWSGMNFCLFSGDTNFALESEGNYVREGGLVDLQAWSRIWHFNWRLTPDSSHEYFQFKRQSAQGSTSGTVLGPEAKVLRSGTALVLVHGDVSDDTQWWKPVRQPDGSFIIVNKADPTLCIAVKAEQPAPGGKVELASLTDVRSNTWRILGWTNSATLPMTPPTAPLEKKILSAAPLADVWVRAGTVVSEALPARVSVTFEGNSKALRSVTWDLSPFNGAAEGRYTLTGTIALDGIETNPDDVQASVVVVNPNISTDSRLTIFPVSVPEASGDVYNPKLTATAREAMTVTLILAEYDAEGRLTNLIAQPVALEANVPVDIQASIPRSADKSYQFFFWDSKPLPLTAKTVTDQLLVP